MDPIANAKSALNVANLVKLAAGLIVLFWVISFAREKSTAVDNVFNQLRWPTGNA